MLGSAVIAIVLRNLVHCALALVVSFAALAALYLQLGAQFIGFAQVLVYVGAVSILIVFAIMLTRGNEPETQTGFSPGALGGAVVALAVFLVMTAAVFSSHALGKTAEAGGAGSVRQLGQELMSDYVLPLEVVGVLLTAAMIGAVILALRESEGGTVE
jgi:NADH-quinone oxidoreductase subunit J